MTDSINFQLGPLVVAIRGQHPAVAWAKRIYEPLACDAAPGLVIEFVDELSPLPGPVVGDDGFRVGEGAIRFKLRRFDVLMRHGAELTVEVRPRDRRPVWLRSLADPSEAWKMWLSHGLSLAAHELKDFAYTVCPTAMQAALLARGAALLHASVIEVDGKAIVLAAWGGVGKSTVCSRSVLHGKARFLADDHAVIDRDGHASLHLLPIHAYAYHARQDATLRQRMLAACPPMNRVQWQLATAVRPKRAVRWVSPADLYGHDKLARRAPISEVIVMFRGDGSQTAFEEIDAASAARPCAGVISEEINGLCDRLALAGAGWATPMLPSVGVAYENTTEVYRAAFARARCSRVLLAKDADGDAVMRLLAEHSPGIRAAVG